MNRLAKKALNSASPSSGFVPQVVSEALTPDTREALSRARQLTVHGANPLFALARAIDGSVHLSDASAS